MAIVRKLREDLDKQIFDTQSDMIELKYTTRHIVRIKEGCTKKKINYARILDILFSELALSFGSSAAKYKSYMYKVLKEYLFAKRWSSAFN